MLIAELVNNRKYQKAEKGFSPYLEIGDIDIGSKSYALKDKSAVLGATLASAGDILVSTVRPTRGAVTFLKEPLCAVSSAFAILEPKKDRCDPAFLFYCLNSRPFLRYLGSKSKGATYPTCSKQDILNYELTPHDIGEQRIIGVRLNAVANTISMQTRQLLELDSLIKARFVEMFESSPIERKTINDVSTFCSRGKSPKYVSSSKLKVINQACIYWDRFKFEKVKYNDESYSGDKILSDGDLLICSTGTGTLGRCNVFQSPDSCRYMADSHVTIVRLDKCILPEIFKAWFERPKTQYDLYAECVSGSTNQIELAKEKLKDMDIPVPPLEIQNQFADFVHQVDKSKFVIQKSLEKTQQLFDSLMQEYFG